MLIAYSLLTVVMIYAGLRLCSQRKNEWMKHDAIPQPYVSPPGMSQLVTSY